MGGGLKAAHELGTSRKDSHLAVCFNTSVSVQMRRRSSSGGDDGWKDIFQSLDFYTVAYMFLGVS